MPITRGLSTQRRQRHVQADENRSAKLCGGDSRTILGEHMKHTGSLDELMAIVSGCGYSIVAVDDIQNGHSVRTEEGPKVNWYTSTGTLLVQGKATAKQQLEDALGRYTAGGSAMRVAESPPSLRRPTATASQLNGNRVFVVHGHDSTSREQLELVLHKLDLDPFVLANTGGDGLTIIEALEREIGTREGLCRFGIVLLTPDDIGYAKKDGVESAEPRARQNVVLEMGMLIAAVGRANVVILKKGHLEVPSDAQGILYLAFNDHVREVAPRLVDRLRNSGFVFRPHAITHASS